MSQLSQPGDGYLHFSQFEDPSQCPPCDNCGAAWDTHMPECADCGAVNPFYRDEIFDDSAWTRGTNLGRRASQRLSGRMPRSAPTGSMQSAPVAVSAAEQQAADRQRIDSGLAVTPDIKVSTCLRAFAAHVQAEHAVDIREALTSLYQLYFSRDGAFFTRRNQVVHVSRLFLRDILALCLLACYSGGVPLGAPDLTRLVISREIPLMELMVAKEIRPHWFLSTIYRQTEEDLVFMGQINNSEVAVCDYVTRPSVHSVHLSRLRLRQVLKLHAYDFRPDVGKMATAWCHRVLRLDVTNWPFLCQLMDHFHESLNLAQICPSELDVLAATVVGVRMAMKLGSTEEPQHDEFSRHLGTTFLSLQCEKFEEYDSPPIPPLFKPNHFKENICDYYRSGPTNPSNNFELLLGILCKWVQHERCEMITEHICRMETFLLPSIEMEPIHYSESENYYRCYAARV